MEAVSTAEAGASGSFTQDTNLSVLVVESHDPIPSRVDQQAQIDDPWKKKNILTFDGGGIRGYFSLLVLEKLMKEIEHIETTQEPAVCTSFAPCEKPQHVSSIPDKGNFLPCHYFDYIGGTSTGGLIAIMLSRFRMPVEDCLQEYENLAGKVFGRPRTLHQQFLPTAWWSRPKYNEKFLEDAIISVTDRRDRNHVRDHEGGSVFASEEGVCQTFVLAYKQAESVNNSSTEAIVLTQIPYIFRSYDQHRQGQNTELPAKFQERNRGLAHRHKIWEIARATTAAPSYFAPMIIETAPSRRRTGSSIKIFSRNNHPPSGSPPLVFIDGAFGSGNNPSMEAYYDILQAHGCDPGAIGMLVSVGTAKGRYDKFKRGLRNLLKAGIAMATDPGPTDDHVAELARTKNFQYFRLNKPNGIPIELDEWKPRHSGEKTRKKMIDTCLKWTNDPKVTESFRECARGLVRQRRLRAAAADSVQWERYAIGSEFPCKLANCKAPGSEQWKTSTAFREHLRTVHYITKDEELEKEIKAQRRQWEYKPKPNDWNAIKR